MSSTIPLISVIVPVYNAEKTLRQCVDSILGQDYRDFELLLIDDGSKDNSPAICDEYAAKDLRVKVFHKPNGGVSSARNLGLDEAQGKWITFIDSDDYVSDDYFISVDNRNEDLILLQYAWTRGDEVSYDKRLSSYSVLKSEQAIRDLLNLYLTTMIFRAPSAAFYKSSIIGSIRFNENMKVGEDTCFVHEYLNRINSIYCIHNVFYFFRLGESDANIKYGSTTEYAIQSLSFIFDTFDKIERRWHVNKMLFNSYLIYFKMVSREEWKKNPSKWYRNPDVRKMYGYIWDSLPFKDKVKYKVVQLLSMFY